MIENIMILDTETTGLHATRGDKVIEVAVILFNLKYKSVLQSFSTLCPCDENPVEKINHIPANSTKENYPYLLERKADNETSSYYYFMDIILLSMADAAQAIIAHNAAFDRAFVATMGDCGDNLSRRKWICTKSNFTWPVHLTRFRLEDICNGMGVPYVNAHRAMNDCQLLAQCFEKVQDVEERFVML